MKDKYSITGMSCSACSANIEKTVAALNGVKVAAVNLLKNEMVVEYDENIISSEVIVRAVEKIGYGASLQEGDSGKAIVHEESSLKEDQSEKQMKFRLWASVGWLIPLMYLSMGHMIHLPLPWWMNGTEYGVNFALMQLLLTLPIIYLNRKFFQVGLKALFHKMPNMDSLVAVGSGAALIYGIFALFQMSTGLAMGDLKMVHHYQMDLYFESAAMILTLVTVGKYLETRSKGKTSKAIEKLMHLIPKQSLVEREGAELWIPSDQLVVGDIVIVKQGGLIGADGIVVEGSGAVDEAAITGESLPVDKKVGGQLVSGTMVQSGYMKFRANKVGADTTLAQIIRLVDEAGASKAPIAKLADKVAGIFVPVVMGISLLTAIIWMIVGADFEFALARAITVLVISCPCALGLATPTAIMVGTGKGAELGILVKSAQSLERMRDVDTIVFDKTGTITEGNPKVVDELWFTNEEELRMKPLLASLEAMSEHPLSKAIVHFLREENRQTVENYEAVLGGGIVGNVGGQQILCGNINLIESRAIELKEKGLSDQIENWEKDGRTVLYVARNNECVGAIAIADPIKSGTKTVLEQLHKMNIHTVMLTGDRQKTAQAVKREVGVKELIAEVLPQDKEKKISLLQSQGHIVAMVGDGINDAPALVRADVGVAIGAGTDIAIEAADLILVRDDLMGVVQAIQLSRAVIRNVKQNLFWAFFYNVLGIPVAAGVFIAAFGLKLNPMMGAAAMSLSSVFVVTNALRLRYFGKNKQQTQTESVRKEEKKMSKTLVIEGMMCAHCQGRVKEVLEKTEGVLSVVVDLEQKTARVEGSEHMKEEDLILAVQSAGYQVISVK